jgi:hypothetical protein
VHCGNVLPCFEDLRIKRIPQNDWFAEIEKIPQIFDNIGMLFMYNDREMQLTKHLFSGGKYGSKIRDQRSKEWTVRIRP